MNALRNTRKAIMAKYDCSEQCAGDIIYLRNQPHATEALEARLVAEHAAGKPIIIELWPATMFDKCAGYLRNIVLTLYHTGHRSFARKLEFLLRQFLEEPLVLAVGDRVRYVGNNKKYEDTEHGTEHYVTEAHFQSDGTVEYVTTRGAWFARSDLKLVERANAWTLAQIPRLMNRRSEEDE